MSPGFQVVVSNGVGSNATSNPSTLFVNQPPAITGYSASNTVEVTLSGTTLIGPVIDTASQNGATSIGSLQFGLKDFDPARVQALKLATQQAKAHADSMAAGMGRTVGNIISIQESGTAPVPASSPIGRSRTTSRAFLSSRSP